MDLEELSTALVVTQRLLLEFMRGMRDEGGVEPALIEGAFQRADQFLAARYPHDRHSALLAKARQAFAGDDGIPGDQAD